MLKNVVIPWYFCVTVLFQFLYQVSVGKIRPNIVFRVKKVTCKPFDKGQKSTRCTSLRKLLGIFTVSLMMRNTNTDSSPNAPSLSHLVSSITDDTPVFSGTSKSKKIHIYSYFIAVRFRFKMQSAMRWRNIPCWWCSTQGHALAHASICTRCIQRRASSRHHPRATRCDTSKDALKTSSGICAIFRQMFGSLKDQRESCGWDGARMRITDDQLENRPLCDSTKRLKGEETLIYTTDRKQTILSL